MSIAIIGCVLSRIGGRLSGSQATGVYCGLYWVIGLEVWTPDRIGVNDPQLLGMALQALGLLAFLARTPDQIGRPGGLVRNVTYLIASVALFSLSLFVKYNLLALPVELTLSLMLYRCWRELAVWFVVTVAHGSLRGWLG